MQFGSRLHFKRANPWLRKNPKKKGKVPKKRGPEKREKGFPLAKLDLLLARSRPESPCRQSCRQRRIAPLNPVANHVANAGLLHSILSSAQDCPSVSHKTMGATCRVPYRSHTCRPASRLRIWQVRQKGRMGKIKLFPTTEYTSKQTPWCPWCHARAFSSGHQNRAKPWLWSA